MTLDAYFVFPQTALKWNGREYVFEYMNMNPSQSNPTARSHSLFPKHYDFLRTIAHQLFAVYKNKTLQPTAVVHEAFLRLQTSTAENEFAFIDQMYSTVRSVLVDHHRATRAKKRGGDRIRLDFGVAQAAASMTENLDGPIDLCNALERLAQESPRRATVVKMTLAGLEQTLIADKLGVSSSTVCRDLALATARLIELIDGHRDEHS